MSIQQITDFLKRQAELNVKRRILPSPTVDVANGGGGYELYAKVAGGVEGISGSSYRGYFNVTLADVSSSDSTPPQKVTVAYGRVFINTELFEVAEIDVTITEASYVYLQSIYDPGTSTIGTPTIEVGNVFPEYEANKFKGLIAIVQYSDSLITDIIQQQHGVMYGFIFGAC